MGQRWTFRDRESVAAFKDNIIQRITAGETPTVEFVSAHRTLPQNDLIRVLYRQVADAKEDESLVDIERFCKLHFGVPILRAADEKFRAVYDRAIKPLEYEFKLQAMDLLPVTSRMTTEQASEYIDTVIAEYQKAGIMIDLRRYGYGH